MLVMYEKLSSASNQPIKGPISPGFYPEGMGSFEASDFVLEQKCHTTASVSIHMYNLPQNSKSHFFHNHLER